MSESNKTSDGIDASHTSKSNGKNNADHTNNSYFKHHVFFCLNERPADDPRGDCLRHGAMDGWAHTKQAVGALKLKGVRINKAGCLDRCEHGPVCVVYPDNVWYSYVDASDLDEIVTEHLQHGRPVTRLMIDQPDETTEA